MIRSIDAHCVAGSDSGRPADTVCTRVSDGPEAAVAAGRYAADSSVESARSKGPRAIGELLQQVLAHYQLVDEGPQPSRPLLAEPENACHAPSLSLS